MEELIERIKENGRFVFRNNSIWMNGEWGGATDIRHNAKKQNFEISNSSRDWKDLEPWTADEKRLLEYLSENEKDVLKSVDDPYSWIQ